MPRKFFQDEEIIFTETFYSDVDLTTTVDPADVILELQTPDGVVVELTVSEDGARPANTGKYIALYIATQYGLHDWRWITDTPRVVKQGTFEIVRKSTA